VLLPPLHLKSVPNVWSFQERSHTIISESDQLDMFKPHTPTKNTKQLAHSPAPEHDFLLKGESLLRKSSPITKPVATTEPAASKTNNSHVSFASDTDFGDEEELSYEEYSEEEGEDDLEEAEQDDEEGTEFNEDDFVEHLAQIRKEHALRLLELEDLYAARANYSLPNSPRVAVHTHAPHCSEDMDYYGDEGEDIAEMIIEDPSPFPAPTAPKWKPKVNGHFK
jgi:broad specificity phosphatase PhoE